MISSVRRSLGVEVEVEVEVEVGVTVTVTVTVVGGVTVVGACWKISEA